MISKRFADVAAYCVADMQKQLDTGLGKKSYCDYIIFLNHYLIPYFSDKFVTSIDYEELQRFAKWWALIKRTSGPDMFCGDTLQKLIGCIELCVRKFYN